MYLTEQHKEWIEQEEVVLYLANSIDTIEIMGYAHEIIMPDGDIMPYDSIECWDAYITIRAEYPWGCYTIEIGCDSIDNIELLE